jgi:hypothetical protein
MANTYVLIASNTVGAGGASSVTFSSIFNTYTDLKLVVSARTNWSGVSDNLTISFNGSTSSFSSKLFYGNGASASSISLSDNSNIILYDGATATSNTFANGEIYIPNYTSSNYKSFSSDSVSENNATTAYEYLNAGLWSNTAAITSITLTSQNSASFVQYSTFYLYGIKNS